jgi:hypothetical protein
MSDEPQELSEILNAQVDKTNTAIKGMVEGWANFIKKIDLANESMVELALVVNKSKKALEAYYAAKNDKTTSS